MKFDDDVTQKPGWKFASGGKLGCKKGSVKSTEQKKEEYKEVISLLKRCYSVRNTAKLSNVSVSTVQRVKREFSL